MTEISYKRSEINPFDANLVDLTTVLESAGHAENPISIREAATQNSISWTQEYVRCQCKTKCIWRTDVLADLNLEFSILNVT